MALNPIIVFFRQSHTKVGLPIAFSANQITPITFNPEEECGDAMLIILNDEQAVPEELKHTNQQLNAPLGVIWHNETDNKKVALGRYGQLTRLTGFSHLEGTQLYDSIKAILENDGNVKQFVDGWRKKIVQFELEELAALINYMALLPEGTRPAEGAFVRYETILGGLMEENQRSIGNKTRNKEFLSAIHELETIAGRGA